MKQTWKVLTIISFITTLIGIISFVCKTRGVNAGAFVFPGIITLFLLYSYKRNPHA